MIDVNFFGRTFVVDGGTGICLAIFRTNEIAKFVSSSILDSYVIQANDYVLKVIDPFWLSGDTWIRFDKYGNIHLHKKEIPQGLIEKKILIEVRRKGYYMLLEQATIIECSYNNLIDLDTINLPMYILNKERYIFEYARSKNISEEESKKHLEFLADSLLSAHFRRQKLMWKYSESLKKVNTEADLIEWQGYLYLDTVGLTRI